MALTALGLAIAAHAQALPSRLTFLQSSGLSLTIEQPSYQPAGQSPTGPLTGTGTYTISVGGQAVFQGSNFNFAGILADQNGQVQTNATGYAIANDIKWTNALGTGTDLTIPAKSKIIVALNGSVVSLTITGAATAQLPFRFDSGNRTTLGLQGFKLGGTSSGVITMDADLVLSDGPKLQVGGFGVTMTSPHIGFAKPATAADGHAFHLTSPLATIYAHLPGLVTSDPFELAATQLSIDETGTPNCSTITLGQPAASTDGAALGALPVVGLAKPLNFGIRPRSISASLKGGALAFTALTFDLFLPEMLTNAAGAPAEIDNVQYSVSSGKFTLPPTPGGGFAFQWKPATLGSVSINLTGLTFDSTVGLSHVSGSASIGAGAGPLASSGGAPLTLKLTDFSIESNGPTGTISVNAGEAKVWNLPVKLQSGAITLDEGEVVGADLAATMDGVFQIGLEVGLSKTGCAITVKAGNVPSATFGQMSFAVTGGSVAVDTKGVATVLISGTATIPVVAPLTEPLNLEFTNLGISNGQIVTGGIKLTKPTKLDMGAVSLTLTEVSYQPSPEKLILTGDVSVPDVLGVGADVSFDGLTISAAQPEVKVTVGGIGIDCKIPGLGTISASITPEANDFNKFSKPLVGSASLAIQGLPGFAASFMLSKNGAWLVALAFDFPQEMLPSLALAPPYGSPSPPFLYLLGVHGAIGYGVELKQGAVLNPSNAVQTDMQTLSNYEYNTQNPNNWMIQLGVDIGTIDEFLLWGPVTLSVEIPAVEVDLKGQMFLLDHRLSHSAIPRVGDPSRSAQIELNYKAPDRFTAQGDINITLGVDPLTYKATGTLQAEFSPDRGFFYAGYPVETNGFGTEFAGIGSKAGFGIDLWPPQNGIQAALHAGVMQYADFFGVVKGKRGLDFSMSLPQKGLDAAVQFDVYVEGDVDFGVISAFARAEASLAWKIGQLPDPTAEFTAGLHTPFGDVDVNTGTVHLLG